MLEPLDRFGRDSTLFQFTCSRLRDSIDPKHLSIQIDEPCEPAKLVEPLEDYDRRDNCRSAIHPEVLVRALLIPAQLFAVSLTRPPHRACIWSGRPVTERSIDKLYDITLAIEHFRVSLWWSSLQKPGTDPAGGTFRLDPSCLVPKRAAAPDLAACTWPLRE